MTASIDPGALRARTVAVAQMTTVPDVAVNLDQMARLVASGAARGAGTVMLPEAFAFLGPDEAKRAILEPLPDGGPILAACQHAARANDVHLIVGGFHEAAPDGRAFNTSLHIQPDGEIAARYRKIHLFDVQLDDGTHLRESTRTAPGDQAVCTELPFGRLGLTICYDLRFPRLYERLTDLGAIALSVPSAFTMATGKDHWHVLLRARAIESQCYVFAPAQFGPHHGTRVSYGHALIVDPWGSVIAECSDGEGVAVATVDPDRVASVRRQLPALTHRRAFR